MNKYSEFDDKKYVLLDTRNTNFEDYFDSFKDFCEDNNYVIEGEDENMEGLYLGGRVTFYDWYYSLLKDEIDDFWYGFKKAIENESNYTRCLITGVVGRWNGNYELGINLSDNLYDAVSKCLKYADDCVISINDNVLTVNEYNHDGSSTYEIRLVNSDNYDKLMNWDDDINGDFEKFLNNPINFNKFYWNYFGMA